MILTGPEIKRQVEQGRITIDPFDIEDLNPNSYNYRLGDQLVEVDNPIIDPKEKLELVHREISAEEGYLLVPGRLYLAHTKEQIGSQHFVTSLIGRSTMGRLGLWLQVSADLGHLGSKHNWTLELRVVQPLRVYPGMRIGQVSFWAVQGDPKLQYHGKYAEQVTAEPSFIQVEFGQ